jgi:hypothetical protein
MSDRSRAGDPALRPLAGGRLLSEITNRIVAFMREHRGRAPIKATTYVLDNLIVCVLSGGFTAIERPMMDAGEPDRVPGSGRGLSANVVRQVKRPCAAGLLG